jgi:hypothetical protein
MDLLSGTDAQPVDDADVLAVTPLTSTALEVAR